ncbi:MAG: T9SS type A sorting domain-containing protein [Bacteroidetes bacterium]|nr:T9SS type A sorting domain-containing protein [Bacteroidota bacterium]
MKTPSVLLIILSLIVQIFFHPQHSYASHYLGADLDYHCVGQDSLGNDMYGIRLRFYRNCLGLSAPATVTICYFSDSCGYNNLNAILNPIDTQEISYEYICSTLNTFCNNPSGPYPGIEVHTYSDTITLPAACVDWVFSWSGCCRSFGLNTISSSGSHYLEARLNNVDAPCNSSPSFINWPFFVVCTQPTSYNPGAIENDGDSLTYSLIDPLEGISCTQTGTVSYLAPFSATQFLSSVPPVSFDSLTGQLDISPTNAGENTVAAIKVSEYRNGVLIGSVIRDMNFYVDTCNNNFPSISGINGTGIFSDTVCTNTPFCYAIYSSDPDTGQNITLSWNGGIPGATFTTTGNNPDTGMFCWTPANADVGMNFFTVRVEDNSCPIIGYQIYTFSILVNRLSIANFSYIDSGLTVSFTDSSTDANCWFWDFGDGDTSSLKNDTHIYNQPGIYTVCLTTCTNCPDSICITINVDSISPSLPDWESILSKITIFPNPAKDELLIESTLFSIDIFTLTIFNVFGDQIKKQQLALSDRQKINVKGLTSGIYFVKLISDDEKTITFKFIKME